MLPTIRGEYLHEIEVRKSRFICALARVTDEEEARAFIAARRKEHWNASHNCTAYVLGEDGGIQRSSDDGEPSGTAGMPMLEVLRQRRLTDTAAVVTRRFGGVKLGAGGLVRAYGAAVAAAIDAVGTVERRALLVVRIRTGYAHGGALESALRDAGRSVLDVRYTSEVAIDVALPESGLPAFTAWLAERSGGTAHWESAGSRVIEVEPQDGPPAPGGAPP